MGLWQMALQKLGVSCHTQKPAPATTITAATTPPMIQLRLALRFGEGACASSPGWENFSSSAIRSSPFL